MIPALEDTIVALSSPPGAGGRAVIRLSGPSALACTRACFQSDEMITARRRRYEGSFRLTGVHSALPGSVLVWSGPRSYTGQDVVEIHLPSCPPLVEVLIADLMNAGARAAQPGEFTLRAFLAGKMDLTRAEAVLGVIEATNTEQLKQALVQLAGGMAQPLERLREDLANLLADVEAGLDFTHEDIELVDESDMLKRLAAALAHLKVMQRQLERRGVESAQFRVVLAGLPNAGKSSLFNALAGEGAALVSPQPGTTRDYLVRRLALGDVQIELVDTAGCQPNSDTIEGQAQKLGSAQVTSADLVILCVEAGTPDPDPSIWSMGSEPPPLVPVATKCDLRAGPADRIDTSARTRKGIKELQQILAESARQHASSAVAPSISRCRHHIDACLRHLRQAHDSVLNHEPPEMLAVDLRAALEHLGEMTGAVYTDELLDRIFSRFCIGK